MRDDFLILSGDMRGVRSILFISYMCVFLYSNYFTLFEKVKTNDQM